MSQNLVICGNFVHATNTEYMIVKEGYCIGVKEGKILFFEPKDRLEECIKNHQLEACEIIRLNPFQFLMPGMIDTHIHASQYPNAGKGLDLGLLEWLNKYTFPTESRFKDSQLASDVYSKVVSNTLRNGTTTACYFATIHTDSSSLLCDQVAKHGQRALVGKVNMDQNSPDFYVEKSDDSLAETKRFVEDVLKRKNPRVQPVITPRFAPSCTVGLMQELGKLAKENNLHIQTHISETLDECEWVKALFPEAKDYVDIYDQAGLLTSKTVLAHGIYLSGRERKVIKERGSSISHCPNSNLSLRSGLLDVQQVLKDGVRIGLGTDVSGGYSPSLLDGIRTAIHVSNTLAIYNKEYKPITHSEAFMMATLGGAKALAMEDTIGNFEVGKEFDALTVNINAPGSHIDGFDDDGVSDYIQKFLYLGDSRNIEEVYVAGKKVIPVTDAQ
ncbi:hypothetical protein FSP39_003454 [Pinctada imbricata]|uniref:Guanine deaminase n=1 Tax=Pinctada imbricata TaxID=66713 RepID=A0AA89C0G1_PINIB|nr:hypothetical protein FSP39_003454 [Pinctada imbricata]